MSQPARTRQAWGLDLLRLPLCPILRQGKWNGPFHPLLPHCSIFLTPRMPSPFICIKPSCVPVMGGGPCPAPLLFPRGPMTPLPLKAKILKRAQEGSTRKSQAPLQSNLEYIRNTIRRIRSHFRRK